ncbi:hypothetical protein Rleg4DRAFT_1711 [Rhizobium leguminosarum bv. trifolii WSM2297]|uniref:Uncharacterized protein n=1 Tax=Rhizobium leguminosarum bv. trifolii WSM2297 TaxID=754762 RepID=J0CAH2_RHILT|nr:hypothetical protein [Rhizobium leguminosarum]EJC80102.1 hypothetical protein Rleg4DRAFT_1711 [Rhizobium leguminosarum bv. trifolii WSM2297]
MLPTMKPTFGRRRPASPEPRIKAAAAQKIGASPDWPKIRQNVRNAALALLIAAKLAIVAVHVTRLNASQPLSEYGPPIALMAGSVIVILGGLWLAGVKLSGGD